jgi:aspartyl/glutamyl-tRNA(Asn/Gln) amidotransferase C subunit
MAGSADAPRQSRIDPRQVRHIAKLARLSLNDAEVAAFSDQLSHILDYFKQIESLSTDGVEPMAHPLPVADVLRQDVPTASLSAEEALAAAPAREGDFFRVPRVLDQGGA